MEHGEHPEEVSTQPGATPISVCVISEMDHIWLEAAQTQASQLITAVECLPLSIPTEMGVDDRWYWTTIFSKCNHK
jgi:hypothetical protein